MKRFFCASLLCSLVGACGDGSFEINREAGVATNSLTVSGNVIILPPTEVAIDPGEDSPRLD